MAKKKQEAKLKEPVRIRFKQLANGNQSIYLDYYTGDVILWNENKIMSVSSGHLTIKLSNFLIDIIKIAECFVYKNCRRGVHRGTAAGYRYFIEDAAGYQFCQ